MEVHHPHHLAHKKKVKEYFLEYFMLFLAVSLGFLAENLRENYVEKEREYQYMESMLLDLEKDKINLEKSIPTQEARLVSIDSVFRFFKANPKVKLLPVTALKHIQRSSWEIIAFRNTATISQLKNSGGFRLIRNRVVADSIAMYDMRWTRIDKSHDRYSNNQREIITMGNKIQNAFDELDAYIENDGTDNFNNIPNSGFVKIDRTYLSEYLNYLAMQQTITRQDMRAYRLAINTITNLSNLIKKEYNIH